jgi:hypothetical protein
LERQSEIQDVPETLEPSGSGGIAKTEQQGRARNVPHDEARPARPEVLYRLQEREEMSEATKRAEEMRQSAIALLLEEKGEIEEQLAKLGWDGNGAVPKRGKACSICSSPEHNARTCPNKTQEPSA